MNNGRVIAEEGDWGVWVFLVVVVAALAVTVIFWLWPDSLEMEELEPVEILWDEATITLSEKALMEKKIYGIDGGPDVPLTKRQQVHQLIFQLREQIQEVKELLEEEFGVQE